MGNINSGIKQFEDTVLNHPDSDTGALAQYKIGSYYESTDKPRLAAESYQKVADDFQTTDYAPRALERVIMIYKGLKEGDDAKKAMDLLFEKFPKSEATAKILLCNGKECLSCGDSDSAIACFRKAAELSQNEISAEAQKLLGDYYYNKNMFKEAAVEYLKTVYLFRDFTKFSAEAQFKAGKSCEAYHQFAEARNAYKRTRDFFATTLWASEAERCLEEIKNK